MMYANASVEITMEEKHNDLTEIIAHALNEMKREMGEKFNPDKVNLAELERTQDRNLTGQTAKIKKSGFIDLPHALTGRKAEHTLLTGFTCIIDELLRKGITNSALCYDRLKENGFQGGLTIVKDYISKHKELVPQKAACGFSRQPWSALPYSTRRIIPDGLGVRISRKHLW